MRIRLILALVLGIAHAVSAQADPTDCSGGCTIITCGAGMCTVWHCDSSGCSIVGTYPDPDHQEEKSHSGAGKVEPLYGKGEGLNCRTNPCTIKICGADECSVIGFDQGEMFELGTLDNTESVLNSIAEDFENQRDSTGDRE